MTVLTIDGIPITLRVRSILTNTLLWTPYTYTADKLSDAGIITITRRDAIYNYTLTAKGKRILDKLNGKVF